MDQRGLARSSQGFSQTQQCPRLLANVAHIPQQGLQLRADFYKKQLIVASQQFSQDLQNLILTPTFVLLGLIVVSVLWPIFSMMSKISTGGMGGMGM